MPLTSYTSGQTPVAQNVQYPFGGISQRAVAYLATIAETIANETILDFAILTGNATLNLTIATGLPVGTKLHLKVPATATETLALGTAIDAPTIVGVAGKTKVQSFYYNGTAFLPMGAVVQID